jgi:hypothetical protein
LEIKQKILSQLREIPGVGKSIAENLWELEIHSITDLRDKDPEILYRQLCVIQGQKIDRCMLYVLRCAVYYASNSDRQPELLKWWNWKDRGHAQR